jgi:hypothetical protein
VPLRGGSADISISAHTPEHLPDPAAGLAELSRITVPGGTVVVNVRNDRWISVIKRLIFGALRFSRSFRGISSELAPGHLWVFRPSLLRAICRGRVQLGRTIQRAFLHQHVRGRAAAFAAVPRRRRSAQ